MKDKKFYKNAICGLIVGVISMIALVGFVQAPSKASDSLAEDLQQEFSENKELIEAQDAKKEDEAKPAVSVTCIGDSVMLGAAPKLVAAIPDGAIDAQESRQVVEGVSILKELNREDKLGDTVVIELGVNCYFNPSTGQEIIDYLGKERKIYWMTVYGKYLQDQDRTNDVIRQLADENANVEVIPWDEVATEHPDWFYNDGIHLNGEGRTGFAQLICDTLGIAMTEDTSVTP